MGRVTEHFWDCPFCLFKPDDGREELESHIQTCSGMRHWRAEKAEAELKEATEWFEEHFVDEDGEPDGLTFAGMMEHVFKWGDGAWGVAGQATEMCEKAIRERRSLEVKEDNWHRAYDRAEKLAGKYADDRNREQARREAAERERDAALGIETEVILEDLRNAEARQAQLENALVIARGFFTDTVELHGLHRLLVEAYDNAIAFTLRDKEGE